MTRHEHPDDTPTPDHWLQKGLTVEFAPPSSFHLGAFSIGMIASFLFFLAARAIDVHLAPPVVVFPAPLPPYFMNLHQDPLVCTNRHGDCILATPLECDAPGGSLCKVTR